MSKLIDLTGHTYDRLTVLHLHAQRASDGKAQWVCRCACGRITVAKSNNLRSGNTRSCGCLMIDTVRENSTTHGHTVNRRWTPEYTSYRSMLARCYDEKHVSYPDYGGSGIEVCSSWLGADGFVRFLSDMGPRPEGTTLDRKTNGDYTPENTRWATDTEQIRNRRTTVRVTYRGRTRVLADWASVLGINYFTLMTRYKHGERGAKLLRPTKTKATV